MGNTLDFSNDTEFVLADQNEQTKQARQWENLDEKTVVAEIRNLNTRVTELALSIKKVVTDNDYENTSDLCESVYNYDLSGAGWLCSVYNYNISRMPGGWDTMSKPSWYSGLSPEEMNGYNTTVKYLKDLGYLHDASLDLFRLLIELPLLEGFRIQRLKMNFEEAGFNKDLYNRIDRDAGEMSRQLSQSWDGLEYKAQNAEKYLRDNLGKMSQQDLYRNYRQMRLKAYQDDFSHSPLSESFNTRSDGTFTVKPSVLAEMGVIDKYTEKVSNTTDFKDKLDKTIAKCKQIATGNLLICNKLCKEPECRNVVGAFETLIEQVQLFAEMSLEVYTSFRDPGDDAPFCFMKKLKAYGSIRGNYSFNPNTFTYDPWGGGTSFRDMYEQAAKAFGQHCQDFAYNHGHVG